MASVGVLGFAVVYHGFRGGGVLSLAVVYHGLVASLVLPLHIMALGGS